MTALQKYSRLKISYRHGVTILYTQPSIIAKVKLLLMKTRDRIYSFYETTFSFSEKKQCSGLMTLLHNNNERGEGER